MDETRIVCPGKTCGYPFWPQYEDKVTLTLREGILRHDYQRLMIIFDLVLF